MLPTLLRVNNFFLSCDEIPQKNIEICCDGGRSMIGGGGGAHICSKQSISKEINDVENEYLNMSPSPVRSSTAPVLNISCV